MNKYHRYQKFRQEIYQMLGKAKDATFELMDSIMTTRNIYDYIGERPRVSGRRKGTHELDFALFQ